MGFDPRHPFDERFRGVSLDDAVDGSCLVSPLFGVDGLSEDYDHVLGYDDMTEPVWSGNGAAVHGLIDFEPDTMVLVAGGEVRGFYIDGQAWIDEPCRGNGYGAAMVAAFVAWTGRLPDVRGTGFTEAGLRTLEAGLAIVRESFERRPAP